MTMELADTERLERMRKDKGVTVRWFAKHLGLSRTATYELFRDGKLPKDVAKKQSVLKKLAAYFGVEVPQILLRLEPRKAG